MIRHGLVALALALAATGCGGASRDAGTTTSAPAQSSTDGATTTAPATTDVVAYFLRDGKVAPVRVRVPRTSAVATAALNALFAGPPEGYDTEVPSGTELLSVAVDGGVATATVSDAFRGASTAAEAQVVYTLTQFPSVTGVTLRAPAGPLPLTGDGGAPLTEPATRADYEQETPRILIESPLPDETVTSPIRVTGTSNDFEATFRLELVQDGAKVYATSVTATSGNGERGTFDVSVPFEGSGPATLVAYEESAATGEGPDVLGRVEVPVRLAR